MTTRGLSGDYATMYKFSLKLKPLCSIILTAILGLLFGKKPKMGKDLKGKELGVGIVQEANGLYVARFTDKHGRRQSKRFKKLQECRQWIADATYIDEHTDIENATDMLVDAWFEYWISVKKKTVRPNTVRNYTERYERNIKAVIGRKTSYRG